MRCERTIGKWYIGERHGDVGDIGSAKQQEARDLQGMLRKYSRQIIIDGSPLKSFLRAG